MSDIRILSIEDDPVSAESLKLTLEKLGYVSIEITDDTNEFLRLARAALPDILLIDVDLGMEIDGIQLAQKVNTDHDIPFIFVTSYKDSGTIFRAKDTYPSAYITKPYESASLQAAIEIALLAPENSERSVGSKLITSDQRSIFLKDEDVLIKMRLEEILFIEVNEKYCSFHLRSGFKKINMRLKEITDRLPASEFVQVHRSYVVAVEAIDQVDSAFKKLKINGCEVPIGRNFREDLKQKLNWIA